MGKTVSDQREERNQSRLPVEIVAPPRRCDFCRVQLKEGEGGICTGCLAKRAAETPSLVAVQTQQMDLTGRMRSSRPSWSGIILDYLRHCESCLECSSLKRRLPR